MERKTEYVNIKYNKKLYIIKSLMKRFSLHRKVTCFLWWDYLNIYNKQINRLHINLKIVTMTKNEGGKIIEW